MEPFTVHRGRAVAIPQTDVDTDQIVPARFCKRITKTGYSDALFAEWCTDPDFVLNDPRRAGATILVAGHNFGIGSSREHAVWALRDWGFRAVISSAFGDIFRQNALKNGLLPVVLPGTVTAELLAAAQRGTDFEIVVDLERCEVRVADRQWPFDIGAGARTMILEGLDEIALTLDSEAAVRRYEQRRHSWLPALPQPLAHGDPG